MKRVFSFCMYISISLTPRNSYKREFACHRVSETGLVP